MYSISTLISGGAALDINLVTPKPFKWISDVAWLNLVHLSNLPIFVNLLNQVCIYYNNNFILIYGVYTSAEYIKNINVFINIVIIFYF